MNLPMGLQTDDSGPFTMQKLRTHAGSSPLAKICEDAEGKNDIVVQDKLWLNGYPSKLKKLIDDGFIGIRNRISPRGIWL